MLFSIKWIFLSNDNSNYFIDIPWDAWYKKYVNTAVNLKIVTTSNKNFNPNWFLTRVEALKISIILFIWDININYTKNFLDIISTDWYSKYVEYAINNNLLQTKDNYFFPNKNITRYEVLSLLEKLSKK